MNNSDLNLFLSQLKSSQFELKDFVDFSKVISNTEAVKIYLNALNSLLCVSDVESVIRELWVECPKAFSVLNLLIAVRDSDKKEVLLSDGQNVVMSNLFKSPDEILTFLTNTGLLSFFKSQKINNLVDYVFGVEVGLDTHARKNRGGSIMQNLVANILRQNNLDYTPQVSVGKLSSEIKKSFGKKRKKFDFVVKGVSKIWLLEVNFYASTGSKINETASSYIELQKLIKRVPGYDFIWITDGKAWLEETSTLENALENINHLYNLYSFESFAPLLND